MRHCITNAGTLSVLGIVINMLVYNREVQNTDLRSLSCNYVQAGLHVVSPNEWASWNCEPIVRATDADTASLCRSWGCANRDFTARVLYQIYYRVLEHFIDTGITKKTK